jgi:hypothetical protein
VHPSDLCDFSPEAAVVARMAGDETESRIAPPMVRAAEKSHINYLRFLHFRYFPRTKTGAREREKLLGDFNARKRRERSRGRNFPDIFVRENMTHIFFAKTSAEKSLPRRRRRKRAPAKKITRLLDPILTSSIRQFLSAVVPIRGSRKYDAAKGDVNVFRYYLSARRHFA